MAEPKVTKKADGDTVVVDDTAPGTGPVTISSTEARASEPVLASEEALTKDVPPPAGTPRDDRSATHDRATHDRTQPGTVPHDAPTSGDGDYVGRENTSTAQPGEPEWNAEAHPGRPGEKTYDGVDYADVAEPRDPMEALEKREIELGAEMDYGEHRRTYSMFTEAFKWGTMVVVAVLVAMAVGFFLSGGFVGGLVVFFGAILAGFVFMR